MPKIDTGAAFSDCRKYRYSLWRYWEPAKRLCLFIMLNPSTADEVKNDPTIERCERRARQLGFGGVLVYNLFAYRATDPQKMKEAADPVGPNNDLCIKYAALIADMVICGWGEHGQHMGRSKAVLDMLREAEVPLHYLKLNKSGEPQHPLYIGYDQQPQLWEVLE